MYEAQKLKWDMTKWDASTIPDQKKELRKAVRDLLKGYCEYKGLTLIGLTMLTNFSRG